jgi:hypothetical protein
LRLSQWLVIRLRVSSLTPGREIFNISEEEEEKEAASFFVENYIVLNA